MLIASLAIIPEFGQTLAGKTNHGIGRRSRGQRHITWAEPATPADTMIDFQADAGTITIGLPLKDSVGAGAKGPTVHQVITITG
mmetsp:Transcript_14986/g.32500  ORF Transcript_14986/g.32500 Transcript_14986/m.32500 type:complete len:84 (-) Transcript_14986:3177-3428(-)